MRLTFINGSPRAKKSNTARAMRPFLEGFLETPGNVCEIEYVAVHRRDLRALVERFSRAERVLLGFPLYIDAMPGIVKEFIEALAPLVGTCSGIELGFVIQCGFPETHHIRYVERYCEKLARRLGCRYLGTVAKGGLEGLDTQPPPLVERYWTLFRAIGREFGASGRLDPALLKQLATPERLSANQMAMVLPMVNTALWDRRMKENGVLDRSFDRPLES